MLRQLTSLLLAAAVIVAVTFALFDSQASARVPGDTVAPAPAALPVIQLPSLSEARPSSDPAVAAWRSLSLGL